MSGHPLNPIIQDLFSSLTPLPPVSDSNGEVGRLFTVPVAPERGLVNYNADESDLSPLSSSDEEVENINVTLRPIKGGRTLRPRDATALTSTANHSTSSLEAMNVARPPPPVDQPPQTSKKRKRTDSFGSGTPSATRGQKLQPNPYVSKDGCHQCRSRPRYAFMRCTSNDGSAARPCRKLFCASCVTKRSAPSPNPLRDINRSA
jgi:hypothetical protein